MLQYLMNRELTWDFLIVMIRSFHHILQACNFHLNNFFKIQVQQSFFKKLKQTFLSSFPHHPTANLTNFECLTKWRMCLPHYVIQFKNVVLKWEYAVDFFCKHHTPSFSLCYCQVHTTVTLNMSKRRWECNVQKLLIISTLHDLSWRWHANFLKQELLHNLLKSIT